MAQKRKKKASPPNKRPQAQPQFSAEPATISLSIIVKNEAKVIERMLNSVYPILDYYVVVDTGSTDGTQEIVRNFFESKGIPGKVIDHPWKNFEDARNKALEESKNFLKEQNAKNPFSFWIDADEQLVIDPRFNIDIFKRNLSRFDGANMRIVYGEQRYYRMQFFNTSVDWRWYGPVHEVLVNDSGRHNTAEVEGLYCLVTPDGNSWTSETQQQKYEGHAKILLDYVQNDPKKDPRWVFYLAQSYRDANTPENLRKSLEWYEKRASMSGGFWEEVYFSMMMCATIKAQLGYPEAEVISSYLQCGKANIHRVEHLMPIILTLHAKKEFDIAYIYSSHCMKYAGRLPMPHSSLFIDNSFYLWKIYDMHIISSWYSGRRDEAKYTYKLLEKLLGKGIIPTHEEERIKNNKKWMS